MLLALKPSHLSNHPIDIQEYTSLKIHFSKRHYITYLKINISKAHPSLPQSPLLPTVLPRPDLNIYATCLALQASDFVILALQPRIIASSRQRPRRMRGEEQQLIWPAPKLYHGQPRSHDGHPNAEIGYVPWQQSRMQQSSSKSSGGTRQTGALEKQEGKGVAAATFQGGQSKQRFSISSISQVPLNLITETMAHVN